MCIIIGKYFDDVGWVEIKNRDRNYIPEISFKKKSVNGVEILYYWDEVTEYCEGMNSNGISILSASLMVHDDEKEIDKNGPKYKDGAKIIKALGANNVVDSAKSLIDQYLTGNTIIFDQNTMFLLEASWAPNKPRTKENFKYIIKKIPKDQAIARTNHGVWISWAGYQRLSDNEKQTLSRISSESRKIIADFVAETAVDPEDLVDNLTKNYADHGQLNAIRTTHKNKMMRTTAQIMIIPKERVMYLRPVQSDVNYNFWELNKPDQKTWVELLSNRILYKNLNNVEDEIGSPFKGKLKHKL